MRVSSKFLKTDTYRDCEAAREIVPQMTMGPVVSSPHICKGLFIFSKEAKHNQYFEERCETLYASLPPQYKEDGSTDGWGMGDLADIGE